MEQPWCGEDGLLRYPLLPPSSRPTLTGKISSNSLQEKSCEQLQKLSTLERGKLLAVPSGPQQPILQIKQVVI